MVSVKGYISDDIYGKGKPHDELSMKVKEMAEGLSTSCHDQLGYQHNNQMWVPTDAAPFNDMTKVYCAAVNFYDS
eukprot:10876764-Ditylum_brightwellii.AAC.1